MNKINTSRITNLIVIFLIILVVSFKFTSSAIIRERDFYRPKYEDLVRMNRNQLNNYIPGKWRIISSDPKAPQIEIRLLKGQDSSGFENWDFSTEYRYSPNRFKTEDINAIDWRRDYERNEEDRNMEGRQSVNYEDSVPSNSEIPTFKSRNIIVAPSFCPKGQRKDERGVCRPVFAR